MFDIENRVLTRVKNIVYPKFKATYPNMTFTTSNKLPDKPTYPYIVIHEMESPETGQDLENLTVNAILSSFEITCYSESSQDNNKEVMKEVVIAMKTMRYSVTTMPFNNNEGTTFRRIARFRRIIGSGDTL